MVGLGASLMAAPPPNLLLKMLPPDVVLENAEALSLTPDQVQRLNTAILPMQRQAWPAQQQVLLLNSQLVAMLEADKPDEQAVMSKFAELEQAESLVKQLRIKMTLEAKKVLSAEQQQKAMALTAAQYAPSGSEGPLLREKLLRVRDGIALMQSQGRDVSHVRELWQTFQKQAEMRHFNQAQKALNEALELVERSTAKP